MRYDLAHYPYRGAWYRRDNPRAASGAVTTLAVLSVAGVAGYAVLTQTDAVNQFSGLVGQVAGQAAGAAVKQAGQAAATAAQGAVAGVVQGIKDAVPGLPGLPNPFAPSTPGAPSGSGNPNPPDPAADTRQPNAIERTAGTPPGGTPLRDYDLRELGGPEGYWYDAFTGHVYRNYKPQQIDVGYALPDQSNLHWWERSLWQQAEIWDPAVQAAVVEYARNDVRRRNGLPVSTDPTDLEGYGAAGFAWVRATGKVYMISGWVEIARDAESPETAALLAQGWFNQQGQVQGPPSAPWRPSVDLGDVDADAAGFAWDPNTGEVLRFDDGLIVSRNVWGQTAAVSSVRIFLGQTTYAGE